MRESPRSGGAQEGRVLYGIETNTRREAARDEERFLARAAVSATRRDLRFTEPRLRSDNRTTGIVACLK